MSASQSPTTPVLPPSQIPVLSKRRSSSSISILQQSTNGGNNGRQSPSTRSYSPVIVGKPPTGRSSRRSSVMINGHGSSGHNRKISGNGSGGISGTPIGKDNDESNTTTSANRRAQMAELQASHERMLEIAASSNLDTSMSSSPGGQSSVGFPVSPGPWTPLHGSSAGLPRSPGDQVSPVPRVVYEGNEGYGDGDEAGPSRTRPHSSASQREKQPKLPHSSSSFDLRNKAITPNKNSTTPQTSEARLQLNRIPQSTVMHALSLHPQSGGSPSPSNIPRLKESFRREHTSSPSPDGAGFNGNGSTLRSPYLDPNSPNANGVYTPGSLGTPRDPGSASALGFGLPDRELANGKNSPPTNIRRVTGPSGSSASTRVIDALQTELLNARAHNERLKQEARNGARQVGQLTRQNEDLKESKERMRVENESLNNVISRKERLLQDVLERARTAESTLQNHLSTRKQFEQTTKKSLATMTTQLTEAQSAQNKAERECNALKESVKSLRDVWGREVKLVKEELRRSEEMGRKEREEAQAKHAALVKLVGTQKHEREAIQQLAKEAITQASQISVVFEEQVEDLRSALGKSEEESKEAKNTAKQLAGELIHLRRLMREHPRAEIVALVSDSSEGPIPESLPTPTPNP